MTGFESKRKMAKAKLNDDDDTQVYADTLLIAYETGFADGKKAAQPEQEPVAHPVIAGALFDFMGWLTCRKERLVLSSVDEAGPAVDAIRDFAKMRGLSLDDAKVQDWQDNATPPAAQPPAEWELIKNILAEYGLDAIAFVAQWKAAQRPWVGLDEDDIRELYGKDLNYRDGDFLRYAMAVEAKLKERNT